MFDGKPVKPRRAFTMQLEAKIEPLAFSASFEVPKPLTKDWAVRAAARMLPEIRRLHPQVEVEVIDAFQRVSIIFKLLRFQYGMEKTVAQIQQQVDDLLRCPDPIRVPTRTYRFAA
jgi:hypothetical protein